MNSSRAQRSCALGRFNSMAAVTNLSSVIARPYSSSIISALFRSYRKASEILHVSQAEPKILRSLFQCRFAALLLISLRTSMASPLLWVVSLRTAQLRATSRQLLVILSRWKRLEKKLSPFAHTACTLLYRSRSSFFLRRSSRMAISAMPQTVVLGALCWKQIQSLSSTRFRYSPSKKYYNKRRKFQRTSSMLARLLSVDVSLPGFFSQKQTRAFRQRSSSSEPTSLSQRPSRREQRLIFSLMGAKVSTFSMKCLIFFYAISLSPYLQPILSISSTLNGYSAFSHSTGISSFSRLICRRQSTTKSEMYLAREEMELLTNTLFFGGMRTTWSIEPVIPQNTPLAEHRALLLAMLEGAGPRLVQRSTAAASILPLSGAFRYPMPYLVPRMYSLMRSETSSASRQLLNQTFLLVKKERRRTIWSMNSSLLFQKVSFSCWQTSLKLRLCCSLPKGRTGKSLRMQATDRL